MKIGKTEAIFVTVFTATIIVIAIVVAFQLMQPLGYNMETATNIPLTVYAKGVLTFTGNATVGELVNISTYTFEYTTNGSVATGHIPVNVSMTQADGSIDMTTAISALSSAIQNNASVAALVSAAPS